VFFSSAEELVDKASFYLRHPDLRDEVARGGERRGLTSGYDIHSRMREWLALL
jgi:spore maturation protein CgeB